ncbi:MAG: hypothetical protein M1820_001257 [Bogoriella megaspora]|nr:MAG: hypothetical protein M1820_001257 [Bogoriella megaspora]
MAPKKDANKPKSDKTAVDKSFGMKNKKGGAAQKQIKQMQASAAANKNPDAKRKEAEKEQREKDKKAAEDARRETAELFKPVQVQKVPFGVDPKTVVCQFFKKGGCDKGKKCKFSHDLSIERRAEKKSLYTDTREGGEEGEDDKKKDTMDNWDEEKLRQVVLSKHGNPKTTTDKVCKFFIEAVENQKYGWFWTCPNGGDKCMYQHKLPPGFVLKTKEQRAIEKALADKSPISTLTLEDYLESERTKLFGITNLTPVTPDTFAKWKKERLDKKAAEEQAAKQKEATGRMLFEAGGWEEDSDEDEDGEDGEGRGVWNLEALRRETEEARARKEEERLAMENGDSGGE